MSDSLATEPVTIGGLIVLVDPYTGDRFEFPVACDLAAAIRQLDEALARRERRRTKGHREVPFSQVGGARSKHAPEPMAVEDSIDEGLPTLTEKAGHWSGPKFSFSQLLGINRPWHGPRLEDVRPLMIERLQRDVDDPWAKVKRPPREKRCPDCGGRELPLGSYCLGCDASGRDLAIPKPTKTELARMPNPVLRRDWNAVAGGTGRVSVMPPASHAPVPDHVPDPAPGARPGRELTPLEKHRLEHPRKRPARATSSVFRDGAGY